MAVTFDQLVARVRQQLLGYARDQASYSELASSMTSGATSFTVDTATAANLSRGVAEIDDELILVKSYDRTTGVGTVMGGTNGRGWEGTTAAAHSLGALVTTSPAYPKARVKEAVNDALRGLYPALVVFATTEITYTAAQLEYELPSATKDIWYVVAKSVGPTKISYPLPNWRYNPNARTADFASGKSIQILDAVNPGQPVRVVYVKEPTALSSGADDFASVSGYPERVADLVVWGACARLAPALDGARLQQQSIESSERADKVPPQSAVRTAQYFQALYLQRLESERGRQFEETANFQFFQGS